MHPDADNGGGLEATRPRRLRRLSAVWAGQPFTRYFLTICTLDRARVLADNAFHSRLRDFLMESPVRYGWHPLRYVVMPDHVHLLAVTNGRHPVGRWVKALKAFTAQREFQWQAGFFDHVLRNEESESEKWDYVRQNPVRAGLVATAEEWPYGGELRFDTGDSRESETERPVRSPGLHQS